VNVVTQAFAPASLMPSPGDVFQDWSEKYGQIYNLDIIFDDTVRRLPGPPIPVVTKRF
jgi:hypothetical protein